MKRFVGILLALLLVAPVSAQSPQIRQLLLFQNQNVVAAGGCSQATAFLARTSGLSGTETTAYTTMICGLVTDGIITGTMAGSGSGASACGSILDALYILATKNTATAELNLCSTSYTLVPSGSFVASGFVADTGWSGSTTSSDYLNTGFIPVSAAGNFALNSASLGVYNRTSRTSGTFCDIGAQDTTSTKVAWIIPTGTNTFYDLNESSLVSPATSNAQGMWGTSRTASNLTSLYKNSSSSTVATDATTSIGLGNHSIFIGATNDSSTGIVGAFTSTDQISAAFIGSGLTGAQYLAVATRINAYMTALLVNVY